MTAQQNALELNQAIRKAQSAPLFDPRFASLEKSSFSQSASATSGLTYYDLESGAKLLYPVLTPLRNSIPRVSGKGGIQAAWRAITAINSSGLRVGVSGGNRGGVAAMATKDYIASYKGIGIETNVDFEAQFAGQNFDDIRALAAQTGLEALMLGEEALILGGNTSLALGVTNTPTLAASNSGGALASGTLSVIVVALTLDGLMNSTVVSGVQASITRTNADSSSDTFGGGAAQKSANATVAVTGPAGSVTASVAATRGAFGYAWYWGAAGSEVLGAITTINSAVIIANAAGAQAAAALPSADNSSNALVFDGLLTQALQPTSGANITFQPTGAAGVGTPLTADGAGGIVEIEAILKANWDLYRLSPDEVWVSSQEAGNISKKILAGGATGAQRFIFDASQDALGGGVMVTSYKNKYSMTGAKSLDIKVHPNMPAGTMLFLTRKLPYPLANVGNVMQIRTRQDYYQIEEGWHSGPHVFVAPDLIWVACDLEADGVHASCYNRVSIGIEMVGDFSTEPFDSGDGAKVRANAVACLAALHKALQISPDTLHFHKQCARDHHDCPGKNVSRLDMVARVKAAMEG